MIPKTIHYCWFGGAPPSALNRRCFESWRRVMPDFEVKRWDESNSPLDSDYASAAIAARRWSRLSNVVRLHAIATEGGVYLDTDVEAVRDFTPLLGHRCFLGFQQPREDEDWVNTAVIASERGHPFPPRLARVTAEIHRATGELARSPSVATRVLREMGLCGHADQTLDGVAVLSAEHFYPYPWYGRFTPACVTRSTYAIHHWEASWQPRPVAALRTTVRRLRERARAAGRVIARG